MSIVTDLRTYLIASISDLKTSNVFIDYSDDSPDNIINLYQYGGVPHPILYKDEQNKKIQILARHKNKLDAVGWLESIETLLYVNEGYIEMNSNKYTIQPVSEIAFLKKENSRYYYVLNIDLNRSR